ncbi:MAG: hypothetical protein L3K03_01710 [Thermoplasmata archaeon]|nr:hypothetical protein [Thermoplasmata archaeon]
MEPTGPVPSPDGSTPEPLAPSPSPSRPRPGFALLLLAIAITAMAIIGFNPALTGLGPSQTIGTGPAIHGVAIATAGSSDVTTAAAVGAASAVPGLSLSISDTPHSICAFNVETCSADAGQSRVTLTAAASPNGEQSWPAVQIAFVIETTAYDGVYDPTADDAGNPYPDVCAGADLGVSVVCEESNGVPFFVVNAQAIANAIQAANPNTQVSFALVDYFASLDRFDDGDGAEYHVDIPQFVAAQSFGSEVQSTFQAEQLAGHLYYEDSDLSDNILHSSSITALYGTIIGSGLDWSEDTHHVIVWMGSTAPRDPAYVQNYCVSPSDYQDGLGAGCISPSCEPSYTFAAQSSPQCEGWVKSQDGNVTHSIAELARTSPTCTDSVGKVCTIDMIDYYDGMTDPYSEAWPTHYKSIGGGPGGPVVITDSDHILLAGCDLAAATGGTWDGPDFFSCPNGVGGSLQYVNHGSYNNPTTSNPTLLSALRGVGFGPVETTLVANGTGKPIFSFVPYGNIRLAPDPQFASACTLGTGETWGGHQDDGKNCPATPVNLSTVSGTKYWGWNWSNNASQNAMYLGDTWSVSFFIVADGPPYTTVPIDSCITVDCRASGSTSVNGVYSSATYIPQTNGTAETLSFPPATIQVILTPVPSPVPVSAPPPPPPPPGLIAPVISPVSIQTPVGVSAQVPVGNVALQATAVGFLVGAAIRVSQRNRPMAVVNLAGKPQNFRSKFDTDSGGSGVGVGRFE